jgi:antitoxin CptB
MVIGQFAIEFLDDMTSEELDQFESLLQESDPDLMTWVSGLEAPPEKHQNPIFKRICNFKNILLNH